MVIPSTENFALQAGEFGPWWQRLLRNLYWSGEAALVYVIAQHGNFLQSSYRIAFQFLLAASGKERSDLKLRTFAGN